MLSLGIGEAGVDSRDMAGETETEMEIERGLGYLRWDYM